MRHKILESNLHRPPTRLRSKTLAIGLPGPAQVFGAKVDAIFLPAPKRSSSNPRQALATALPSGARSIAANSTSHGKAYNRRPVSKWR